MGILKSLLKKKPSKYYQTKRELERLTDRELNDIGIGRHDIERIARGDSR